MARWTKRSRAAGLSTRDIVLLEKKKKNTLLTRSAELCPGFSLHVSDYGADALMLPSHPFFPVDFVINLLGSVWFPPDLS